MHSAVRGEPGADRNVDAVITSAQLIIEVRRLIGVKFLHQGRSITAGVDCSGMGVVAAKHAGLEIMAFASIMSSPNYGRLPSPMMLEKVSSACRRLNELRPGALLLFKPPRVPYPHHLAIYTDTGTMIHSEAVRAKAVVEQTYGRPWSRLLHSIWAIPGVEYPEDAL